MDVYTAIQERRSIRKFNPAEVEQDKIQKNYTIGISGGNSTGETKKTISGDC